MKTLLWAATAATMTIGGQAVMADTGLIKVLDTIRGTSFLAIQAAIGVFQRRNPDVRQYRIEVVRMGNSDVVIFAHQDRKAGAQLDAGVRLGADTELSALDLQALRSSNVTPVDTIQGSSFLAIQSALGAFQRHNPDLSQYKIEVVRDRDSVVVIFVDKDRQLGTKGSLGPRPGFEVELNPDDLRVVGSNFVR